MTFRVKIGIELIACALCVILMAVGAFGPWIKGPLGLSVSGTDGDNDGWVVVGAAAIAAGTLWGYTQRVQRSLLVFAIAAAAVAGGVAWHDRNRVKDALQVAGEPVGQVGWGLNLALAASVGLGVASFALLWKRPELSEEEDEIEYLCPYCREPVHEEATVCPHCRREIS